MTKNCGHDFYANFRLHAKRKRKKIKKIVINRSSINQHTHNEIERKRKGEKNIYFLALTIDIDRFIEIDIFLLLTDRHTDLKQQR